MSLPPGEQRTLVEIENQLRESDPGLAAMFAAFGKRAFRKQRLVRKIMILWRPGLRPALMITLAVALACMLIGSTVLSIVLPGHGGLPANLWGPDGRFP